MKQKNVVPADSGWVDKKILEFPGSPFQRIGKDWMLISAGETAKDKANWNTMTASWGGLGVLWAMNVAFIFIRPCRYTFDFANATSLFTLSFFDESQRGALKICGEQSGRDIDKASVAGLSPIVFEDGPIAGAIGFKEAKEIIICRKLYTQDIDPSKFLDAPAIEKHYPKKDYHRMYVGEVIGFKARG